MSTHPPACGHEDFTQRDGVPRSVNSHMQNMAGQRSLGEFFQRINAEVTHTFHSLTAIQDALTIMTNHIQESSTLSETHQMEPILGVSNANIFGVYQAQPGPAYPNIIAIPASTDFSDDRSLHTFNGEHQEVANAPYTAALANQAVPMGVDEQQAMIDGTHHRPTWPTAQHIARQGRANDIRFNGQADRVSTGSNRTMGPTVDGLSNFDVLGNLSGNMGNAAGSMDIERHDRRVNQPPAGIEDPGNMPLTVNNLNNQDVPQQRRLPTSMQLEHTLIQNNLTRQADFRRFNRPIMELNANDSTMPQPAVETPPRPRPNQHPDQEAWRIEAEVRAVFTRITTLEHNVRREAEALRASGFDGDQLQWRLAQLEDAADSEGATRDMRTSIERIVAFMDGTGVQEWHSLDTLLDEGTGIMARLRETLQFIRNLVGAAANRAP